jgi:N-glycosylase/DNA lyase
MTRASLRIRVPQPFDLKLAVFGHGWVDLPPFAWDDGAATLRTAFGLGARAVDCAIRQNGSGITVTIDAARAPTAAQMRTARDIAVRMLALDCDFAAFWQLCAAVPRLRWVAQRGAGRLLRAPTLFEDLLKLLFTTNCSWTATRGMTARLVEALGPTSPAGQRAFPGPRACAEAGEGFFRDTVRAGYRARACVALAAAFARGELSDAVLGDARLPTDALRERLLSLPGFGPYATGQALRLLGRHDDFALDSWCRNRLAEMAGRRRPPSPRSIERTYRPFGTHRGLALWMDLTAAWHGEGPLRSSGPARP